MNTRGDTFWAYIGENGNILLSTIRSKQGDSDTAFSKSWNHLYAQKAAAPTQIRVLIKSEAYVSGLESTIARQSEALKAKDKALGMAVEELENAVGMYRSRGYNVHPKDPLIAALTACREALAKKGEAT